MLKGVRMFSAAEDEKKEHQAKTQHRKTWRVPRVKERAAAWHISEKGKQIVHFQVQKIGAVLQIAVTQVVGNIVETVLGMPYEWRKPHRLLTLQVGDTRDQTVFLARNQMESATI